MLFAEDFQLCEHISSGSCYTNEAAHVVATYASSTSCLYYDGDLPIFTYGGNCTAEMELWRDDDLGIDPSDITSFKAKCYNAFSDFNNAFVS